MHLWVVPHFPLFSENILPNFAARLLAYSPLASVCTRVREQPNRCLGRASGLPYPGIKGFHPRIRISRNHFVGGTWTSSRLPLSPLVWLCPRLHKGYLNPSYPPVAYPRHHPHSNYWADLLCPESVDRPIAVLREVFGFPRL